MKSYTKCLALSTLITGSLLYGATGYAQQAGGLAGDKLGAFAGVTDRYDSDFSFGVHYEHPMADGWSAGALVEHSPDAYGNDAATLVMGTANFRPAFSSRLKVTGGAGIEFKDIGGDDVKFRAGLAYDLFLEDKFTLSPLVAFNLGEGKDSVTLGATLFYQF